MSCSLPYLRKQVSAIPKETGHPFIPEEVGLSYSIFSPLSCQFFFIRLSISEEGRRPLCLCLLLLLSHCPTSSQEPWQQKPGTLCSSQRQDWEWSAQAATQAPLCYVAGGEGECHAMHKACDDAVLLQGKVPPLVHSSSVVPTPKHEQGKGHWQCGECGQRVAISRDCQMSQHQLLLCHLDISLSGVKQALSLLRWHRDRLDHLEASSGAASEGTLHVTICTTLVDIVTQVFNIGKQHVRACGACWVYTCGEDMCMHHIPCGCSDSSASSAVKLLPRADLIITLIKHQQNAEVSCCVLASSTFGGRGLGQD